MSDLLARLKVIREEQASTASKGAASAAPAPSAPTGAGDPEIQSMNAEAPLLDLIRADTGEQGRESGDRIDFRVCPVCGHRDCFRYYPSTNSWSCFGESNASGYAGGSFTEYERAVHGMDATEAVKALREATGHPYEGKAGDVEQGSDQTAPKLLLPPWEQVRAVDPPRRSPVLVEGILRRGHVAMIAGRAKTGKSWLGIELAVAVATGSPWLRHACARGPVLFVDPELDRRSLDNRFHKVAEALGADPAEVEAHVVRWSLRGVMAGSDQRPPTIADVAHDVASRCSTGDFALVIVDSASCLMAGDENAATDVRRYFAHVLRIARATGAGVLLLHHFGKGNSGDRDAIDRARGSSVWIDSPDAPLSLTEVFPPEGKPSDYLGEGERALVLEDAGLREFPSMEPLHVIFSYPVHRLDAEGVTASWKPRSSQRAAGQSSGETRRQKAEARANRCIQALAGEFIARGIGAEGIAANEAADVVSRAIGEAVKASTLKAYVDESELFDVWQKSERRWLVVPRRPPSKPADPQTLDLASEQLSTASERLYSS